MAQVQFLATAQQLIPFDETCLVEIAQSPAFSRRGVELAIQPRKLRGNQLAIFGFPSHGNCRLTAQQHFRMQQGSADLIEDKHIEFISPNAAFWTPPVLAARTNRIAVAAMVIIADCLVATTRLLARYAYTTVTTFDESTQKPSTRLSATCAPF